LFLKKEQDKQDQLRWQDKQDLIFYPAHPADVSSILLILFLRMIVIVRFLKNL